MLTDAKKHLVWKEHYKRHLNEEFPRVPVIGPQPHIDKECVISTLPKMKKGKASETSVVVSCNSFQLCSFSFKALI